MLSGLLNPKKAIRYILVFIKYSLRKKKGVLFFIGMDPNGVFNLMFRGYEVCYGFEPSPERFKKLHKKYKKYPQVHIFNVAAARAKGEVKFNISSNKGASSSLGKFNEEWLFEKGEKIKMTNTIDVPSINLYEFCSQNNISTIDDYISDIQGMDLEVLKTLEPMLVSKSIKSITCEVTKNEKGNVYSDLPDNSEKGFNELLQDNYQLVAKGWGILVDGKFDQIPEHTWEFDCKWKLKEPTVL